uniref:rRNA biogenesis protein rrp5 n=1 Tax=Dulem virus 37 TaxID=3145755 RepID=A0AAU8AZV2_9CAUD
MAQITLTLDLTPETLEILKLLASASNGKTDVPSSEPDQLTSVDTESSKDKKPAKKTAAKDKKPATKDASPETEDEAPAISLTDVRAVALKLSKAGKQAQLKEIFAKYGATKLSDISAEHYGDLMADLEEANG